MTDQLGDQIIMCRRLRCRMRREHCLSRQAPDSRDAYCASGRCDQGAAEMIAAGRLARRSAACPLCCGRGQIDVIAAPETGGGLPQLAPESKPQTT